MSNLDSKRFYWLKLDKDFFKKHEIVIVENMPNGKDYVLFYLKLLCESTSHEGFLRFSNTIPYSEEMLSSLTNTNVDIVRSAIKIFSSLKLMEILDDGTIFLEEVSKMIGTETGAAIRKREYREKVNGTLMGQCPQENRYKILDTRNNKKENILKERNENDFIIPSIEDVQNYCLERNNSVNAQMFVDYYSARGWMLGSNPMVDWKAVVRVWEKTKFETSNNQNIAVISEHSYSQEELDALIFNLDKEE